MYVRYAGSYAVPDLEKMRLSVTKVSECNDPFELFAIQGKTHTEKSAEAMLRRMVARSPTFQAGILAKWRDVKELDYDKLPPHVRAQLLKNVLETQEHNLKTAKMRFVEINEKHTRQMSFCELADDNPSELLMWSYYADGHKGVRLHVSEDFLKQTGNSIIKIRYAKIPPKIDADIHPLVDHPKYDAMLSKVFSTKSKVWAHEQEFRLLLAVRKCKVENDVNGKPRLFTGIGQHDLVRIDLGCNFQASFIQVANLKKLYPNLAVFKAHRKDDAYSLRYEKVA